MGYALRRDLDMTEMNCGTCGIDFMVPERWREERKKTGEGWYCPNGHCRVYKETRLQEVERELKQERQRSAMEAASRRSEEQGRLRAERELKRITKRVNAGVCPCCNRTFQNLARHMKTKHSEAANA